MKNPNVLEETLMWKILKEGGAGKVEDELGAWHYQFNGHEFEHILRDGEAWCAVTHMVAKICI